MRPDIINAPALQDAIDELLEGASPALQSHRPALRAGLRRALESHESVRKALRRKSDPDWAQSKFAEGRTLHRFFRDDLWDWEINGLELEAGLDVRGRAQLRPAARGRNRARPEGGRVDPLTRACPRAGRGTGSRAWNSRDPCCAAG